MNDRANRLAILALLLTAALAGGAGPGPETKPPPARSALQLEDPATPLLPKQPRTQADQDRLEALALFAAGRMREQQQDLAGALRLYQRALRFDPKALPVLEQIVPLAFNLNRPNEAVRYALKAVELDPSDALMLRRLGVHLTEQGDLKGAIKLYEKAQQLDKPADSAAHVVLRMEMGRLYYVTGEYGKSAEAFTEVMEALKAPEKFGLDAKLRKEVLKEPAKLYAMFGDAFLEAGQPDKAAAAFERGQEAKQDKALFAYQMARVQLAAGEPAKALATLDGYFNAHSAEEQSEPYELLARLLEKLDRKGELLSRLEQLHKADPENQPLGHYLAQEYLDAQRLDEAAKVTEPLHASKPTAESYQRLAKIYRLQKQPAALIKLLGQMVDESNGLDDLDDESSALVEDKPLVEKLIAHAREQLKAQGDKFGYGPRLAAALVALDAKEFSTAEEFFNAALALNNKQAAEVLMLWGVGLLSAERNAEAAVVFKRGIDEKLLPKENPAFYYYLSGALELDGQTDAALSAARKAVALNTESPRLFSRIAWIQYHAKRYDDAIASYKELVERYDATQTAQDARNVLREARLVLSNIYVTRKDIPQAEEWLQQVLDEFPEDAGAMNDLGYLWADQGKNLPRALEMVRFAVDTDPNNHAYHDSLGWALYKLGRYAEALEWLKKATDVDEPDGVILDHLGDCQIKLKLKEDALATWRRALKAYDKDENKEEIEATKKKIEEHK